MKKKSPKLVDAVPLLRTTQAQLDQLSLDLLRMKGQIDAGIISDRSEAQRVLNERFQSIVGRSQYEASIVDISALQVAIANICNLLKSLGAVD